MKNSPWLALSLAVATCGCGLVDDYGAYPAEPSPSSDPDVPTLPPPPTTIVSDVPPPPISGGTLALDPEGQEAAAADPERDRLWIVDLVVGEVEAEIRLEPGDEPGRVVHDGATGYLVVLRGGGLAHVAPDLDGRWHRQRVAICPAPRGVAVDHDRDRAVVACAGGEVVLVDLVTLERELISAVLPGDLRDVVINDRRVYISRFRSAEVLVLDPESFALVARLAPRVDPALNLAARVAWRMVPDRLGVRILHQMHSESPIPTGPSTRPYYGSPGPCARGIVSAALTSVHPAGSGFAVDTSDPLTGRGFVLPVDLAIVGSEVAVASAGSPAHPFEAASSLSSRSPCGDTAVRTLEEGAVAVAISHGLLADSTVIVQTRDPWTVSTPAGVVSLISDDRSDTGHDLFHHDAGAGIACASCHPEGTQDGHVWQFESGPRRTQDLGGGVLAGAPFHWSGDMASFEHLVDEVFTNRMSGPLLHRDHMDAMGSWIDTIPRPPAVFVRDLDAVERGRALFEDPDVGCTACHSGPRLTNDLTVDVGAGESFQVPSLLGVGNRLPALHDGCANTLEERFSARCNGDEDRHGRTSHLAPAQTIDLAAYLRTL